MADGHGDREQNENNSSSESNLLNNNLPNGESSLISMVQAYTQEYENLDHTLNEIDTWMNKLEEQNDTLNSELDDLLESSKQARQELKTLEQEKSETNSLCDEKASSTDKNEEKKS
ncbi:hypothetical protein ACF0H5_007534 [Mactra antiquata]